MEAQGKKSSFFSKFKHKSKGDARKDESSGRFPPATGGQTTNGASLSQTTKPLSTTTAQATSLAKSQPSDVPPRLKTLLESNPNAAIAETQDLTNSKEEKRVENMASTSSQMCPIGELWNDAYDELRTDEYKLIRDYEDVLSENLTAMKISTEKISDSKSGRQQQMENVLKGKIIEAQNNTWKLKFGSKDIPVTDLVEPVVGVVDWANTYVSDALAANPYASVAWAGVGLLLPLFLNPSKQAASLAKGLDYIADLIVRSSIRENLYSRRYESPETMQDRQAFQQSHLKYRDTLKGLYIQILKFQANSICYFSKNGAFRLGLDMIQWDNWGSALGDIKGRETAFCGVYDIWKDTRDQEEYEVLYKRHKESLGALTSIGTDVSGLKKAIVDAQKDGRRLGLLGWLSSVDPSVNFNNAIEKHELDTGNWLVESGEEFNAWKKTPNSILWLNGPAGAGKSILSSSVISRIIKVYKEDPETALAYFYFAFNDPKKQTAVEMLGSLIKQLCCCRPDTPEPVQALRQYLDKGQRPDLKTIHSTLSATIQGFSNVYIVLDGLDESPIEDNERKKLLNCLRDIYRARHENLHIFCASRREIDIESVLIPLVTSNSSGSFDMDLSTLDNKEKITHDIGLLIDRTFATEDYESWPDQIKAEAKSILIKNSDGMIQYVACQFDVLQRLSTPGSIRKALKDLPKGLDATYDRMLLNVPESGSQVWSLLQFLSFSKRPLNLGEISEIYILKLDSTDPFDDDDRLFKVSDVLKYIPSLVTKLSAGGLDSDEEEDEEDDKEAEVQFAHYSIKEYLLSKRILQGDARDFAIKPENAQICLAKACLLYNSHLSKSYKASMAISNKYLFWEYAAAYSLIHLENTDQTQWESYGITPLFDELATPNSKALANMVEFSPVDGPLVRFRGNFSNPTSLLYYTCSIGAYNISSYLISKGADVNQINSVLYRTALQAAAWHGHVPIINLLLEHGANPFVEAGYYGNALQAACASNHPENLQIVKILLENGIDINTQGGYFGNALQAAVNGGGKDIINLLVEKGADIHAKGGIFGNVIRTAVARSHVGFVRVLVDKGVRLFGEGMWEDEWDEMFMRVEKAYGRNCSQRLREAREDVGAWLEEQERGKRESLLRAKMNPLAE